MHRSCGCKVSKIYLYLHSASEQSSGEVRVFLIKLIRRKTVSNTLIEILLQETEIRWPDISKCVT
jgi:hypothetical protein